MAFKIKTVDYLKDDAPNQFVSSLKNTGFAVLKNHPIDNDLVKEVYSDWENFFDSSAKNNYLFHKEKQDGYFPFKSENAKGHDKKDLKEFYHIYPWGRYPVEIGDSTQLLYDFLLQIGEELLSWIDDSCPAHISKKFSVPLADMFEDSDENLLRIINYPPLKDNNTHGAIRAQEHEDINLITLLVAATQPGLQVKDTKGKWINVKSNPGYLIINIGDMLQECSGGYFPSTPHRVVNPKGKDMHKARLSMPLFVHPSEDIKLSDQHTAKSYLDERLQEIGLKV